MPYVSCKYAPPPSPDAPPPSPQMAICTDEAGTEWWLDPETSGDPDFKAFIADGGTIEPYEPPAPEEQPPVISALAPSSAYVGDPDLTLYVIGENFTAESKILFDGGEEPTTFVSAAQLSTVVEPSQVEGAWAAQVTVRTGDRESAPQTFAFIEVPE